MEPVQLPVDITYGARQSSQLFLKQYLTTRIRESQRWEARPYCGVISYESITDVFGKIRRDLWAIFPAPCVINLVPIWVQRHYPKVALTLIIQTFYPSIQAGVQRTVGPCRWVTGANGTILRRTAMGARTASGLY